jgi:hypothetical protein
MCVTVLLEACIAPRMLRQKMKMQLCEQTNSRYVAGTRVCAWKEMEDKAHRAFLFVGV